MATYSTVDTRRTVSPTRSPTPRSGPARDTGLGARVVNMVLGAWLFLSAFLWPHAPASRLNTWLVGLLSVVFAASALRVPTARFFNTALSLWLFFSTVTFVQLNSTTLWNNLVVSLLMFVVSLIPSRSTGMRTRPPRYAEA